MFIYAVLVVIGFLVVFGDSIENSPVVYSTPVAGVAEQNTSESRSASQPTVQKDKPGPTEREITRAIRQSDDFQAYEAEFREAARELVSSRRCKISELEEIGGFVKSQTHKTKPIYFTYCGGVTVRNRIYVDVLSGDIFK